MDIPSFKIRFELSQLQSLAMRYSDDDTEVMELRAQVVERGYLTQSEFLAICAWKSPRAMRFAKRNSSKLIEEITQIAFSARTEYLRIGALTLLHGVQIPTASAILHLTHNDLYPILDFRALWSLGVEVSPSAYSVDFWLAYIEECRRIAEKSKLSMRTVDRALWQYSAENQPRGK
jgi:hypothetical protein